ncbi:MAG: hypothetical protein IPL35_11730 [Sphingobacteriales bacterium]|nr:hypothetical protein [Sphingobacteriales bacterium]
MDSHGNLPVALTHCQIDRYYNGAENFVDNTPHNPFIWAEYPSVPIFYFGATHYEQVNICSGDAVELHFSEGDSPYNNISWSAAPYYNFGSTEIYNNTNITVYPAQTTTFYLTLSSDCENIPQQILSFVINVPLTSGANHLDACIGSALTLMGSSNGNNVSYHWEAGNTYCPPLSNYDLANPIMNTNNAEDGSIYPYFLTVTNEQGCVANETFYVHVFQFEINAGDDIEACVGEEVHIESLDNLNYICNWSVYPVNGAPIPTNGYVGALITLNTANATPGTYTYTLTATNDQGCTATDALDVIITQLSANAGNDITMCPDGSTITLSGQGTPEPLIVGQGHQHRSSAHQCQYPQPLFYRYR